MDNYKAKQMNKFMESSFTKSKKERLEGSTAKER